MTVLRRGRALICTGAAIMLPVAVAWGEGGLFQEGGYSVFRTGGVEPLLTLAIPLSVPARELAPRLEFTFGFTTAEPFGLQTFFDSFSAAIENADSTVAALLLTVDREQTLWAPARTGGLLVRLLDLMYGEVMFADLAPEFDLKWAYTVSYALPPELVGQPATLLFELFDSGNEFESMAYVTGVQLSSLPVLQCAAAVDGPYADLAGVESDWVRRELRVSLPWGSRFFRLSAPVPTRIWGYTQGGLTASFRYTVEPPVFGVESSAVAEGDYVAEPELLRDFERQQVTVVNPGATRFYRIRSTIPAEITAITPEGEGLVLRFAFPGMIPVLEWAEEVGGPYGPEPNAQVATRSQSVSWSAVEQVRFFRLRSDRETRITSIRISERAITFSYQ
jgi:hypothetical protein